MSKKDNTPENNYTGAVVKPFATIEVINKYGGSISINVDNIEELDGVTDQIERAMENLSAERINTVEALDNDVIAEMHTRVKLTADVMAYKILIHR